MSSRTLMPRRCRQSPLIHVGRLVRAVMARVGRLLFFIALVGATPLAAEETSQSANPSESAATPPDAEPESAEKQPQTLENSLGMKLVLIPAGEFVMGSPQDEQGRMEGEFQRTVNIERPFYMSIHEVTQAQYERIMDENPSGHRGAEQPVENMQWTDAVEFCRRLSAREKQTYWLPTEAEWEYACRAGTTTPFHFGESLTEKDANFDGRYPYGSDQRGAVSPGTKPVGSYEPNAFGLYDMHGNVLEWCLDVLPDSEDQHILRGGGGLTGGAYCRSAQRWAQNRAWIWYGFRVVRTVDPQPGELDVPRALPLDRADRFTTREMIAKVDEAFDQPADGLLPAVVVFPVVEQDRRVTAAGIGACYLAHFALADIPERRMQIAAPYVRYRLMYVGCLQPAVVLDNESIDLCLSTIGTQRCVLSRIEQQNERFLLECDFYDDFSAGRKQTVSHKLTADELVQVPGLIARDVLQHMGVTLSEEQIAELSAPVVRSVNDMIELGWFVSNMAFGREVAFGRGSAQLAAFLEKNPRCAAAWMLAILEGSGGAQAWERLQGIDPPVECQRLLLSARARQPASQDVLLELLKLAARFRGDTQYHYLLVDRARRLPDAELAAHLLDVWRSADPSYAGCLIRSGFLLDWAWDARGGRWASEVSDEGWTHFGQRIRQARRELEQAIELNPRGWEVHAKMITIGMAGELSRQAADEHFETAVRLRPRYRDAYWRMFRSLQLRWGGSRHTLLAFARRCIRTGYWNEGIPDIARNAIEDLCYDSDKDALLKSAFGDLDIWAITKRYYESGRDCGIPGWERFVLNVYAKYGAYGERFQEVADAFAQIEEQGADPRVFSDGFTYDFLRDQVVSKTGSGPAQAVAAVRLALDTGDFDKAEELLDGLDPADDETESLRERFRRAVDAGRKLKSTGLLELSTEEGFQLFEGTAQFWTFEEDRIICRVPPQTDTLIRLPFGIRNVEITGIMGRQRRPVSAAIHLHTRAMRDYVSLVYKPRESYVSLERNGRSVDSAHYALKEFPVRVVSESDSDHLEPIPGLTWTAPALEDAPGGIAFHVKTDDKNAVVFFKDLKIRLIQ